MMKKHLTQWLGAALCLPAIFCLGTAWAQEGNKDKPKTMCDTCAKESLGALISKGEVVVTKVLCLLCRKADTNQLLQAKICEGCAEKEGVCLRCLMPMQAGWPKFMDEVQPPTSDKIVFISDQDGDNEIFIMDADGKNPKQLTQDKCPEMDATVSPNGKYIVFTAKMDRHWDLYLIDIEGKHLRRLTKSDETELSACWFPDSEQLVFILQDDPYFELHTIKRDGSDNKEIKLPGEFDNKALGFPDVSPDGTQIAFVGSEGNKPTTWEIYIRNEKGEVTQFTKNELFDSGPVWSPDGKRIAYVSSADATKGVQNDEIWLKDATGKNEKRLTDNAFLDGAPRWSADGKKLVFITCRDKDKEGLCDIYVMDAGGKNPVNLTKSPKKELGPRWVKGVPAKKGK